MAQLALLPPKESTINFNKGSIDLLKTSQLSLKSINKQLVDRTKAREDAYDDILGIRRKRETLIRSQIRESELEATSIVQKKSFDPLALGRVSSIGGGSILDRILKTVSLLFAGWIIKDLPIWIARAKEFMFRLNKAGEIIKSVLDNTIKIFTSTFGMIDGIRKNLMEFDFSDDSNRIRNSFNELTGSIEEIGVEFENGIKLITTPLLSQTPGGDNYGTFSGATEGAFNSDGAEVGGGGTVATYGTKEQRAVLDTIAFAEGARSYGTIFGGNVVPELERGELTVREVHTMARTGRLKNRNLGYGARSGATGRYQFMPDTLADLVKNNVLSWGQKFTPAAQDKAAIALMERRGVTQSILAKEGFSTNVANKLSPEWAAVPTERGGSYYRDQRAKKFDALTNFYKKTYANATTGSLTDSKLSALTGNTGKSQGYKEISTPISPFLKGKSGTLTSGYGKREGKLHRGYDVGVDVGTPLYAYFPGVMVMNQYNAGGFGYYIVWKDSVYGKHHLFGHLKGPGFLKEGQKFNKGQILGQSGNTGSSTGPHLHWQIGSSNIFSDTIDPGKWLNSISKPDTEVKVSSPTSPPPAPTLPPPTPSISSAQMSSAAPTPLPYLTPSNKPKDIIAAVQIPSAQNVKTSVPSSEVSNRQTTYSSMIQTYMKKRLLIALSYV